MRQGETFTDAQPLEPFRSNRRPRGLRRLWRGGLIETLAVLRYRDEAAYDEWLDERDTIIIAATLARLSDRQLHRIGLARETLAIGVEDLKRQTERGRQIARETLRLIESDDQPHPQSYAAE